MWTLLWLRKRFFVNRRRTIWEYQQHSEAYSEQYQTSKMKHFRKIVSQIVFDNYFRKRSILDVWYGSEYVTNSIISSIYYEEL